MHQPPLKSGSDSPTNRGGRERARIRRLAPLLLAGVIAFGGAQVAGQGVASATASWVSVANDPFYQANYSGTGWMACGGLDYGQFEGQMRMHGTKKVEPGVNWRNDSLRCTDASYTTQLVYAHLSGANLQNADFNRVNLAGADLSGADFLNAVLTNTNLKRADLTGARIGPALGDDESAALVDRVALNAAVRKRSISIVKSALKAIIDDQLDNQGRATGRLLGIGATKSASLELSKKASLFKMSLTTSLGRKVMLRTLLGAAPGAIGWLTKLLKASQPSNADLSGADLTDADLSGATIVGGIFTAANLSGAK
ncbi:MAG: pentapeptide repeat-containing protein, partial [Solirubrobacterales bacterium]|nr:pentapeptide repeat-containing protein [Solirubrobacterales bacterium]